MNGDIFIRQYHDMIEITNPGGFPYGVNIGNILTVNSSPRSRLIAEVVEKTGLIERSGQGVDIMFANCISEGRPLPDYSHSDDYQVSVIIKSEINDPMFTLFLQDLKRNGTAMNVFALMNLYGIHRHHLDCLYDDEIPAMLEKGIIAEHPYYRYVLGNGYFANMMPVRKGVCTPLQLSRVHYALEENGNSAAMSAFVLRTGDILTQKQTRTLIEKLCNCGYLQSENKGKNTRYRLR